jgi:hypothetical protein
MPSLLPCTAFRNWMNSLGVEPFVNNLYQDLRDGIALLWLFNKVRLL